MTMYETYNDPTKVSPFELERLIAYKLGARLVTDRQAQREDKDLELADGVTVSVKRQDAAARTGNISLEVEQISTRTGEKILGNFRLCRATYVLIAVPRQGEPGIYTLYLWEHKALARLADAGGYPRRGLGPERLEANRRLNRQYDDAVSVLVPLADAAKVALGQRRLDCFAVRQEPGFKQFSK